MFGKICGGIVTSGLTYAALTGSRKQSVVDAERLFSPSLAKFMEKKGYNFEAKYIRTIWNWHRACDERGLTLSWAESN